MPAIINDDTMTRDPDMVHSTIAVFAERDRQKREAAQQRAQVRDAETQARRDGLAAAGRALIEHRK